MSFLTASAFTLVHVRAGGRVPAEVVVGRELLLALVRAHRVFLDGLEKQNPYGVAISYWYLHAEMKR